MKNKKKNTAAKTYGERKCILNMSVFPIFCLSWTYDVTSDLLHFEKVCSRASRG